MKKWIVTSKEDDIPTLINVLQRYMNNVSYVDNDMILTILGIEQTEVDEDGEYSEL